MRIDILTLFPDMFNSFYNESIIARAIKKKLVTINIVNIRDFSTLNHGQVDDTPYGGGPGMVLMCEPVFKAVESLKKNNSYVIMMSPQGVSFVQKKAFNLASKDHLIIICGHYEGFDERIRSIVDLELSVGDYVLTGGEIPSMIVVDAVVRLIPGVINESSLNNESFSNNLLDYPTYTKPRVFRNMEVPEILLSGNHQEIEKYRTECQIKRTKERRPDILG